MDAINLVCLLCVRVKIIKNGINFIQTNSEQQIKNFNSFIFNLFIELGTRLVWDFQMEIKDVA